MRNLNRTTIVVAIPEQFALTKLHFDKECFGGVDLEEEVRGVGLISGAVHANCRFARGLQGFGEIFDEALPVHVSDLIYVGQICHRIVEAS